MQYRGNIIQGSDVLVLDEDVMLVEDLAATGT